MNDAPKLATTEEDLSRPLGTDACPTCHGKGTLSEPSDRPGVTVTARCWRCDGTGYGR